VSGGTTSSAATHRRRKRKRLEGGARLNPVDVDEVTTDELFAAGCDDRSPRDSNGFVIDLPAIERAEAPLPRQLPQRRPVTPG
jgi:hypothetical protein